MTVVPPPVDCRVSRVDDNGAVGAASTEVVAQRL